MSAIYPYACPVPPRYVFTNYDSPGSYTALGPIDNFSRCEVVPENVVITPPGTVVVPPPPGQPPTPSCSFLRFEGAWEPNKNYYKDTIDSSLGCPIVSVVLRDGALYICNAPHISDIGNAPNDGIDWEGQWTPFGEINRMRWLGDWVSGYLYKQNDVVHNPFTGLAYVSITQHTSAVDDEPGIGGSWEGKWKLMVEVQNAGLPDVEQSFLDGLQDSVFDWIKNASVGDWLFALAAGAGIIWAGSKILDMMTPEFGTGDGQADSRYTGTPAFSGAFTQPTLPGVVSSIMSFAGYGPGDYDVSQLPAHPVNFTINQNMSLRNLLGQLALVYQFDVVPSGEIVKFVPKFGTSVRTLTKEDLGHTAGDNAGGVPYIAKRLQGIDLPRRVVLIYQSKDLAYNAFSQEARLGTFTEGQTTTISVPMMLEHSDAKRIVETALANAHIEQQQFTFVTDYNNIDLEPGDVVSLPLESGGFMQVRVIQVVEAEDGLLEMTVSRADFNTDTYTSTAPTTPPPDQVAQTPVTVGYSGALFLEIPHLDDSETLPRIKVAIHGYGVPGWGGAVLYRSNDGGNTFDPVLTVDRPSKLGIVANTSPLNTPITHQLWDNSTTITVQVQAGVVLETRTDLAVLNGENWCMVGEEMIGFVNATLVGTNTYQLTRLLRGRQGTEAKIGNHLNNELFVVLDSTLPSVELQFADLNKPFKYKVVSIGSDPSKVAAEDVQSYGGNFRPWSVVNHKQERQPNGDWIITWTGRVRVDNELKDYGEIAYDVDFGGWGLAIWNSSGTNVLRREGTLSNSFTYTAAQQITDFGSPQLTLTSSVTQMSTRVGGGYPSKITT